MPPTNNNARPAQTDPRAVVVANTDEMPVRIRAVDPVKVLPADGATFSTLQVIPQYKHRVIFVTLPTSYGNLTRDEGDQKKLVEALASVLPTEEVVSVTRDTPQEPTNFVNGYWTIVVKTRTA